MPGTPASTSRTGDDASARSAPVTAISTPHAASVARRPKRAADQAAARPDSEAAARPRPSVSPIRPAGRPRASRWIPTRTAEKPNPKARRPRAASRSLRFMRGSIRSCGFAMPEFELVTPIRRIVSFGGGGFSRFGRFSKLDDYVLALAGKDHPRVLFLGTAGGDADSHIVLFYEAFAGRARPMHLKLFGAPSRTEWRPLIRDQDVIYVGGGNTANMLAIW